MLMSLSELMQNYDLNINGVLHLGAHTAEEAPLYRELGCEPVAWVEANPYVLDKTATVLADYPDQVLYHACIYSEDNVLLPFNVTNYDGMSSSIFDWGTHPQFSPDTVFEHKINILTMTVDKLVDQHGIHANFLNMDLQGAELHALHGATNFLRGVDYVMTEVNSDEVYKNCARIEQLDACLAFFTRVETYWVPGQGWGDALYIRTS